VLIREIRGLFIGDVLCQSITNNKGAAAYQNKIIFFVGFL
jgi:hypothetical protein